jgi:hypothetical protein
MIKKLVSFILILILFSVYGGRADCQACDLHLPAGDLRHSQVALGERRHRRAGQERQAQRTSR